MQLLLPGLLRPHRREHSIASIYCLDTIELSRRSQPASGQAHQPTVEELAQVTAEELAQVQSLIAHRPTAQELAQVQSIIASMSGGSGQQGILGTLAVPFSQMYCASVC